MRLDLNFFFLLLLAYVNGGWLPENLSDGSNFLHEVRLVAKPDYRFEALVGCIINKGNQVVVPKFPDPDVTVLRLRIKYADRTGADAYANIKGFTEPYSASLLVLEPDEPIPMSEYAKEAQFLEDVTSVLIRGSGAIEMIEEEIDLEGVHRIVDKANGLFRLVVPSLNVYAPRGSSLIVQIKPKYERPVVIAMYEEYRIPNPESGSNNDDDQDGEIVFTAVDKLVLRPRETALAILAAREQGIKRKFSLNRG